MEQPTRKAFATDETPNRRYRANKAMARGTTHAELTPNEYSVRWPITTY